MDSGLWGTGLGGLFRGSLGLGDRKTKRPRLGSRRPGVEIWLRYVPSVGSWEGLSGLQLSSSRKQEGWRLLPSPVRADGRLWGYFPLANPPLHSFLPCCVPWGR